LKTEQYNKPNARVRGLMQIRFQEERKNERKNEPKRSDETIMESLILAQDERWRRA